MIKNEVLDIINKTFKLPLVNEEAAALSLILNDFLGGIIIRYNYNSHIGYYNIMASYTIDLSSDIFKTNEINISREDLLKDKGIKREYIGMLKQVEISFIKHGEKEYKLIDGMGNQYESKIPGTLGGNSKLKIYGCLDCASALSYISKGQYVDYRVFFASEDEAISAGYRPCAKCMPIKYKK